MALPTVNLFKLHEYVCDSTVHHTGKKKKKSIDIEFWIYKIPTPNWMFVLGFTGFSSQIVAQ